MASTATALVTGGSRGFGLALSEALADAGWRLVIDSRNEEELEAARSRLSERGSEVVAVAGDVNEPSHATELVDAAVSAGSFRLLVNNASYLGPSPQPRLGAYPTEVLAHVLATNVIAPLRLIQESLPHLRAGGGTVVNVTSDAAIEPYPGWGGYGMSKAALEQMSNVLATEEPDVRVYWFDPGDMRTRMHHDAFPGEDISDRPLPETRVPALLRLLAEDAPSGRYVAEELLTSVTG